MVARHTQATWVGARGVSIQADVLRARLCALTVTDGEVYGHARRLLSRAESEYCATEKLPSGRISASEQRDREALALLLSLLHACLLRSPRRPRRSPR